MHKSTQLASLFSYKTRFFKELRSKYTSIKRDHCHRLRPRLIPDVCFLQWSSCVDGSLTSGCARDTLDCEGYQGVHYVAVTMSVATVVTSACVTGLFYSLRANQPLKL